MSLTKQKNVITKKKAKTSYDLQKVDCNCNDCTFMARDINLLKEHKKTYEGTGLMDDLMFGDCIRYKKPVSFIPNVCQLETQDCFIHRKDLT